MALLIKLLAESMPDDCARLKAAGIMERIASQVIDCSSRGRMWRSAAARK